MVLQVYNWVTPSYKFSRPNRPFRCVLELPLFVLINFGLSKGFKFSPASLKKHIHSQIKKNTAKKLQHLKIQLLRSKEPTEHNYFFIRQLSRKDKEVYDMQVIFSVPYVYLTLEISL